VSVHFFHGDKGGVGKSFVAQSFVDWLITRGTSPLVVDSDMRNPDLARMFPDVSVTVDLRQHEGWLELLSLLHESDREQVVVSLPAGIGAEMTAELPSFFDGLRELGCEATLLWVLARTPDSINLLRSATTAFDGRARAMVAQEPLLRRPGQVRPLERVEDPHRLRGRRRSRRRVPGVARSACRSNRDRQPAGGVLGEGRGPAFRRPRRAAALARKSRRALGWSRREARCAVTFEEAFREINGRTPTPEEVKRVLAIRRVVKEADLDPVELFFLADANAAAERAKIPAAIATGVDAGVARLQQAIPDAGELAKRIAIVGALQKTLSALVGYATPIAALAAIVALAIALGAWRWGYGNGWNAANDRQLIGYDAYACRALANVRHAAVVQRRASAVTFVAQEMTARGCR